MTTPITTVDIGRSTWQGPEDQAPRRDGADLKGCNIGNTTGFRAEMGHYSSVVGNSVHLIAPDGHFAGQVVIMGQDKRLRERETQEKLLRVIVAALNSREHRSFPDAADGRPLPPMGDELMTAGLNGEDARFVANQLAQNGLVLVPAGGPTIAGMAASSIEQYVWTGEPDAVRAGEVEYVRADLIQGWTATAQNMLSAWDGWLGGDMPGLKDDANRLILAACFAAQAFDDAAEHGITSDGAPGALLRAFLIALIDPNSTDLDQLRACNRAALSQPEAAELASSVSILRSRIEGVEGDMAADAEDAEETGERVDLRDYEVTLTYEAAQTILAALRALAEDGRADG